MDHREQHRYLIIWRAERDRLECGFLSAGQYLEQVQAVRELDAEVLPFLVGYAGPLASLSGIAVSLHDLGGFASTRLLMVTLNLIAEHFDIPIVQLDSSVRADRVRRTQRIGVAFSGKRGFEGPLLPQYARPADITTGTKRRKFTIR